MIKREIRKTPVAKKELLKIDANWIIDRPSIEIFEDIHFKYPNPYLSFIEHVLNEGILSLETIECGLHKFTLRSSYDRYVLDPFTCNLKRDKYSQPFLTLDELKEAGWKLPSVEEFVSLLQPQVGKITFNYKDDPYYFVEHIYNNKKSNFTIHAYEDYFVTGEYNNIRKISIGWSPFRHPEEVVWQISDAEISNRAYVILTKA